MHILLQRVVFACVSLVFVFWTLDAQERTNAKGGDSIDVRPLRSMRLHARAIIRDGSRAFVGSQSLRRPELDQRREVGVVIPNASVTRKLREVFEQDWAESATGKDEAAASEADVKEGSTARLSVVRSRRTA